MQEQYLVMVGCDGVYTTVMGKEKLLKSLHEDIEGKNGFGSLPILTALPDDLQEFHGLLILKVEVVVPKAVNVVTRYEI